MPQDDLQSPSEGSAELTNAVVTDAMIAAGVKVYLEQSFDEEDDLIRAIYLAMLQAR